MSNLIKIAIGLCAITTLFITSNTIASIPTDASGRPLAGQTLQQLQAYKAECSECALVAADIVDIRFKACGQQSSVDMSIIRDPLYPLMNSVRMLRGRASAEYAKARKIVESTAVCDNNDLWIERSQQGIELALK